MNIAIIAAVGRNGAIGCRNRLPWAIPEDMAHFKALTMGHTIIMGRMTYESLPHGALPGRRNIVVSTTITSLPDAEVYASLEHAISACNTDLDASASRFPSQDNIDTIFIIGGASVYGQALPLATTLHLTLVDDSPADADAFFPSLDLNKWVETKKEKHTGFSFATYHLRK